MNEHLTKALQCCILLCGDLREAHSKACRMETSEGRLLEMILLERLKESTKLELKLRRMLEATGDGQ